tara:strand:+ start:456 stop:809 length:354 start_codon:yes stop_codon:yes gene_type:complete
MTQNPTTTETGRPVVQEDYDYAVSLIAHQKRTPTQAVQMLINDGIGKEMAVSMVANLSEEVNKAKKDAAQKDILYGALWCVGGTVATLADVGYIFWGAIVFGGIQMIKGFISLNQGA